jgi:hypothetical protein
MGDLPIFFGGGLLVGIILFFILERTGLIHKLSGLKPPPSKSSDQHPETENKDEAS